MSVVAVGEVVLGIGVRLAMLQIAQISVVHNVIVSTIVPNNLQFFSILHYY